MCQDRCWDERFCEAYSRLCEISKLPLKPETEAELLLVFRDLNEILNPRKQTQEEIIREVTAWKRPDSDL